MIWSKKRMISAALALLMTVNICTPAFAAIPEESTQADYIMTEGELVAHAYRDILSDEEEALLADENLMSGEKYAITRPTANSGLIEINQENKTIVAKNFTNDSLTWVPVSASVFVENEKVEEITLTDGTGNYTTTEDRYSVVVNYQLSVAVAAEKQTAMLNTAVFVKDALAKADNLSEMYTHIEAVQNYVPTMVTYAKDGIFPNAKDSIEIMQAQITENGKLDIIRMLDAYKENSTDTAAKLAYLSGENNRIDIEASESLALIEALINDGSLAMIVAWGIDKSDEAVAANNALNSLKGIIENYAGEWPFMAEDLALVSGYDVTLLASYIDSMNNITGNTVVVEENVLVETVEVKAAVSLVDVVVTVKGKKSKWYCRRYDFSGFAFP